MDGWSEVERCSAHTMSPPVGVNQHCVTPVHSDKGSSVDPGDPSSPSSDQSKRTKCERTHSQAADSLSRTYSLKCPHCRKVIEVEVGEELGDNYQPGSSNQDWSCERQDVLQKLKCLVSQDCFQYAEHLMKTNAIRPTDLWNLIEKLSRHQRAGGSSLSPISQPSSSSSSSSHSWHLATVRVFCVDTGETFGAHDAIMEQVKKKWTVTQVQITDVQECDIIVVFCPVTCRAGSDVDAAMRNTAVSSSDKSIILVVMHHTRDTEYSTAGRKCSEMYPRVVLEVHVLFHETQPGLLRCTKNSQAVHEIKKEIYKRGSYEWSLK